MTDFKKESVIDLKTRMMVAETVYGLVMLKRFDLAKQLIDWWQEEEKEE